MNSALPRRSASAGRIRLDSTDQIEPLATASFRARLPMETQDWRDHFQTHVRGVRSFEDNPEDANRLNLVVEAPGIDKIVRTFERPLKPLRWKAMNEQRATSIRLISHFGEQSKPTVTHYSLEAPDWGRSVDFAEAIRGLMSPCSGLYRAACLEEQSGVLVPKHVSKISDLALNLRFQKRPRSFASANELLRLFEAWHAARVLGELPAFVHRRTVLDGLVANLFDCIASEPIAIRVLAHASSIGTCREDLLQFLTRSSKWPGLTQTLIQEHSKWVEGNAAARLKAFRRVLMTTGCPGIYWTRAVEPLCEFALRLASAPETVRYWRKGEFALYLRIREGTVLDLRTVPVVRARFAGR